MKNDLQDRNSVLAHFGITEGRARKAYRQQVLEQSSQGRQAELTGGGLIRSMGGWSAVRARRKQSAQEVGDERILGSSEFVQEMLAQAATQAGWFFCQQQLKHQFLCQGGMAVSFQISQDITGMLPEFGISRDQSGIN